MAKSPQHQIIQGVAFPATMDRFQCEMALFKFSPRMIPNRTWRPKLWHKLFEAHKVPPEKDPQPYLGTGRFEHSQRIARGMWPDSFEWHDWSTKAVRAFCENKRTIIRGCGNSSKSTSAAMYAVEWFMCDPRDSAVLNISTSIDGAKRRIWREINRYYQEWVKKAGDWGTRQLESPRPTIFAQEKDGAHICGIIPVGGGAQEEGIRTLKGFHPKRVLMICDELDSIAQDVVDIFTLNLQGGTIEAQFIGLGNDPSPFNPLGKICDIEHAPQNSEEYETEEGVKVLVFDGFKSPNIRDGNKWSGIITKEHIDEVVARHGMDSRYVDIFMRGRYNPLGAADVVIPESVFIRFHARDRDVIWRDTITKCALLDPAFGGDRCVWRPMSYGYDAKGIMKILYGEIVVIPITAKDAADPAEYQIARRVQELNKSHGVLPKNFILDCTGTGRGAASVLQREYSQEIITCEFGGSASDDPVSATNPKKCREEYDRKITELYFTMREFVEADMVRGLDMDTCREFTGRTFKTKKSGAGNRFSVQDKAEYKADGNPSPDLADNAVLGPALLKHHHVLPHFKSSLPQKRQDSWHRIVQRFDIDARSDCYS